MNSDTNAEVVYQQAQAYLSVDQSATKDVETRIHVHGENSEDHKTDNTSETHSSQRSNQVASKKERKSNKKVKKVEQFKEIDRFQIAMEINSMQDVEKQQEKLSIIKAHLPFPRLFFLGCLAGWWLGLGVILVITMSGGIPISIRTAWPMLPKIVTGFLFPVGICFISLFGGELFTGNSMCMLIGLLSRRITLMELAYNWIVVLVSNFAGAVFTVYLFSYLTELHGTEPWLSYVQGIAVAKINMKPEVAFLRAIPANALVCTCLLLGLSARDMLGKMAAMWFPIMVFAATGFEHAIANMAFVPLGLMYGADADYKKWLYQNLLLVILGNIVGGGIVVGGAEYFLFDWTRLLEKVENHQNAHEGFPSADIAAAVTNALEATPLASLTPLDVSAQRSRAPSHCAPSEGHFSQRGAAAGPDPERVRAVFGIFDSDGDGAIDAQELLCALHALGFRQPFSLLRAAVRAHSGPAGCGERFDLAGLEGYARLMHELQALGLPQGVPTSAGSESSDEIC